MSTPAERARAGSITTRRNLGIVYGFSESPRLGSLSEGSQFSESQSMALAFAGLGTQSDASPVDRQSPHSKKRSMSLFSPRSSLRLPGKENNDDSPVEVKSPTIHIDSPAEHKTPPKRLSGLGLRHSGTLSDLKQSRRSSGSTGAVTAFKSFGLLGDSVEQERVRLLTLLDALTGDQIKTHLLRLLNNAADGAAVRSASILFPAVPSPRHNNTSSAPESKCTRCGHMYLAQQNAVDACRVPHDFSHPISEHVPFTDQAITTLRCCGKIYKGKRLSGHTTDSLHQFFSPWCFVGSHTSDAVPSLSRQSSAGASSQPDTTSTPIDGGSGSSSSIGSSSVLSPHAGSPTGGAGAGAHGHASPGPGSGPLSLSPTAAAAADAAAPSRADLRHLLTRRSPSAADAIELTF